MDVNNPAPSNNGQGGTGGDAGAGNGNIPPANGGNGAPASNTGNGDGNGTPTDLTPEQWQIAFNSQRFKDLNAKAKTADDLKAAADKAEADKLAEQGKHQELAAKYQKEAEDARTALKAANVNNAVMAEAAKLGAHDPSAVARLIDSNAVTVNDDGSVTGVEEAVKGLQTTAGYLFRTGGQGNTGGGDTGGGSGGGDGAYLFKASDFSNATLYAEKGKEMDAAMTAGKVDMSA